MGPRRVLTEDEKEAEKKRRSEKKRLRYAAKRGAEREQMLEAKREARRRRVSAMGREQREAMLETKRQARRRRRAALDHEQREAVRRSEREAKQRWFRAMAEEQRQELRVRDRLYKQRMRAAQRQSCTSANCHLTKDFDVDNFRSVCSVCNRPWLGSDITAVCECHEALVREAFSGKAVQDFAICPTCSNSSLNASKAVIVPRGSSGRLSGSSEHSFRGTDAGDATTTDSEQHSMAFFVAQVGTSAQHETTIVPNSTVRSVGLGFPCAEASVGKACTGTQTTASSDAPLHVEKGLANVTSLGEWSRARRVASRLVSHKIGQATAALQFNLPVAHKSVQCVPRVKSKSTQFSGTSTRTSRSRPTRRAAVRPSSASALKTT